MAQIAMIAGLGMMCLSSSVGAALMMGGGEEDDGAGGEDDEENGSSSSGQDDEENGSSSSGSGGRGGGGSGGGGGGGGGGSGGGGGGGAGGGASGSNTWEEFPNMKLSATRRIKGFGGIMSLEDCKQKCINISGCGGITTKTTGRGTHCSLYGGDAMFDPTTSTLFRSYKLVR
jgi:hypothetical protein